MSPTIYIHAVAFDPLLTHGPSAFFPIARLDHGASLTAFDERKLQPFASAADGGYPELSPWRSKGMPWVLESLANVERWKWDKSVVITVVIWDHQMLFFKLDIFPKSFDSYILGIMLVRRPCTFDTKHPRFDIALVVEKGAIIQHFEAVGYSVDHRWWLRSVSRMEMLLQRHAPKSARGWEYQGNRTQKITFFWIQTGEVL